MWTSKVGRPHSAQLIAATQDRTFALNTDGTLWLNPEGGRDSGWVRFGREDDARLIAAASLGQSGRERLYRINDEGVLAMMLIERGTVPGYDDLTTERTFEKPRYAGRRLDYCLNWARDCGQEAATVFCRVKGYARASSFDRASNIGADSDTWVLGDRRVCDEDLCDGFTAIQCSP